MGSPHSIQETQSCSEDTRKDTVDEHPFGKVENMKDEGASISAQDASNSVLPIVSTSRMVPRDTFAPATDANSVTITNRITSATRDLVRDRAYSSTPYSRSRHSVVKSFTISTVQGAQVNIRNKCRKKEINKSTVKNMRQRKVSRNTGTSPNSRSSIRIVYLPARLFACTNSTRPAATSCSSAVSFNNGPGSGTSNEISILATMRLLLKSSHSKRAKALSTIIAELNENRVACISRASEADKVKAVPAICAFLTNSLAHRMSPSAAASSSSLVEATAPPGKQ